MAPEAVDCALFERSSLHWAHCTVRLRLSAVHGLTGSTQPHVLFTGEFPYTIARLVHDNATGVARDELVCVIVNFTAAHSAAVARPPHFDGLKLFLLHLVPGWWLVVLEFGC